METRNISFIFTQPLLMPSVRHLLPVLDGRIDWAIDSGGMDVAWDAGGRVPVVVTRGPGQSVQGKAGEEVVEGPAQHHDVVNVSENDHDRGAEANPWKIGYKRRTR